MHLQRKERLEGNMKKRSRRKFYILILVWILLIVFTGRYFFHQAPLSTGDVQTILHENWEDIQSITDWLVHSEYETIYLSEEDLHTGEAWADFSAIPLNEEILLRAQRLINAKGFHGISKNAGENTIAFYMWTDGIEADCGASYPQVSPTFNIKYLCSRFRKQIGFISTPTTTNGVKRTFQQSAVRSKMYLSARWSWVANSMVQLQ